MIRTIEFSWERILAHLIWSQFWCKYAARHFFKRINVSDKYCATKIVRIISPPPLGAHCIVTSQVAFCQACKDMLLSGLELWHWTIESSSSGCKVILSDIDIDGKQKQYGFREEAIFATAEGAERGKWVFWGAEEGWAREARREGGSLGRAGALCEGEGGDEVGEEKGGRCQVARKKLWL